MSNHQQLLTNHNSTLINRIVSQVCQTIIVIHAQQPELLLEKYRSINWQNSANQATLREKFTELLSPTENLDELQHKLKFYLKALLIPESSNSPILKELTAKIEKVGLLTHELHEPSKLAVNQSWQQSKIAILLLDAENLQINLYTEKFLATICTCPIHVKIAFANWSNRGKLDVDLHERGYDLIHVPSGRDNADGKMIAFGSSIHERYPNVKEVLVCSSDKVMTNLCNNLQQRGLIVYQVSQQGENIRLFNSHTGKIITHNLKYLPDLPDIEQLIQYLKSLIKAEQKRTNSYWIKLSILSNLFKNKYKLTLTQVINKHFPGKKAKDLLVSYPADFVIHQIDETSELFVTLFEKNHISLGESEDHPVVSSEKNQLLSEISSQKDLEQALKKILVDLTSEAPNTYINIGILGSKFRQEYGKSITDQIKELKLSSKFMKFLHSCKSFAIKQTPNGWEVRLNSTLQ